MRDLFLRVCTHPHSHRVALAINNIAICIFWVFKEATIASIALHGSLAFLILIAAFRGIEIE